MSIFFVLFACILIASSFFAIFVSNLFRSVMALAVFLCTMAGMYILLSVDFIAAIQILLYVGGILVIVSFVIMLIADQGNVKVFFNIGKCVLFLFIFSIIGLFSRAVFQISSDVSSVVHESNIKQLARWLFNDALMPFEIISLVLLVALLGAVFFTLDHTIEKGKIISPLSPEDKKKA